MDLRRPLGLVASLGLVVTMSSAMTSAHAVPSASDTAPQRAPCRDSSHDGQATRASHARLPEAAGAGLALGAASGRGFHARAPTDLRDAPRR